MQTARKAIGAVYTYKHRAKEDTGRKKDLQSKIRNVKQRLYKTCAACTQGQ